MPPDRRSAPSPSDTSSKFLNSSMRNSMETVQKINAINSHNASQQ